MHNSVQALYDTQGAVDFLNELWGQHNIVITKDKFYHAIARSDEQYPMQEVGKVRRYRFTEDQLRRLRFYGKNSTPKPKYEHVQIHGAEDLARLERKYGCKLVTEEGIAAILQIRFKKKYKIQAIRQRLRRGDIDFAGYGSLDKKNTYWYPVSQLDNVRFYPKLVKQTIDIPEIC